MKSYSWSILGIGSIATLLTVATVLFVDWMRSKGIVTWGDLFSYRRRARRMRAAIARGAVECTCRTGRRTVTLKEMRGYDPIYGFGTPTDVQRSVDCSFCSGVGAYKPGPKLAILSGGRL